MVKHIVVITACLCMSVSAYAQSGPQEPGNQQTEDRELMPAPDSPKILPHVYMRKTPEGGTVISGHGTHNTKGGPESYNIEVDEKRGTYKATPVPPPSTPLLPGGSTEWEQEGKGPFPPQPDKGEPHSFWRALQPAPAYADWTEPGNWWGAVSIVGRDPVNIAVCALQSQLSWWANWPALNGINWYYDHLEAVHPTIVGTNWWLDWYSNEGTWWGWWGYAEGWQQCHSAVAQFYNVDFPPGITPRPYNNRTTLWFKTQMCGRDESHYDWWWWWWRNGPYSGLLNAVVTAQ